MTAAVDADPRWNAVPVLRWAACFGLVLGLHISVVLMLLRVSLPTESPAAAPEAIMLDLAPAAVTPLAAPAPSSEPQPPPEPPPTSEPPSPKDAVPPQPEVTPPARRPAPQPQTVAPPPLPEPAVALPPPPPPARSAPPRRPATRPPTVRQPSRADQATAPTTPEAAAAPLATAPATPAAPSANAVANWRGELIERLQRAKHYPDASRARNEQGIATATFTIDRSGHILSVSLAHSSGSPMLDEEAVAMIRRAEPLPPIPAGLGSNTLTLTVPVTFSLQ